MISGVYSRLKTASSFEKPEPLSAVGASSGRLRMVAANERE
jgi:hypothetical protein